MRYFEQQCKRICLRHFSGELGEKNELKNEKLKTVNAITHKYTIKLINAIQQRRNQLAAVKMIKSNIRRLISIFLSCFFLPAEKNW